MSLRYVIQKQTIEEGLKVMVSQYWKVILGLDDHEAFMLHICDLCDLYHDPFGETSISPHRSYPCGDRTSVVKSVGIPGWNPPRTETVPVAKKHIQISDFCWQISNLLALSTRVCFRDTSVVSEFWYLHAPFRGAFHSRNPKVLMKIPCWSSAPSSTVPPSKPKRRQLAAGVEARKSLTKKTLGCSGDMEWYGYVLCVLFSHFLGYWCIHGILLYHVLKISWNLCKYVCITVCACGRWIVIHTPENDVLLRVPVLPIMSNGCESWIGTGS